MRDSLQLQTIKAIYCETADLCVKDSAKAASRLRELFTPDVQADYGMGLLNGRDAVIGFLSEAIISNNESLWHSLHTPHIDVQGDTATAEWTVLVRMKPKGAAASEMIYGRYIDEFRRTPQGWLISSIRFLQEG
jgi:ketosteroid isomerase-like protein